MNIVFIGGHRWEGPWFRKQQFAYRFSQRGHKVFYIEDSISIMRWKKTSSNHPYKIKIKEINTNLFIITPPVFLPLPSNKYLRSLYNFRFFYLLKKLLRNYDVNEFILWFNRIEYSTYLKFMKVTKILDLCDDLPGYALLVNNKNVFNKQMHYLKSALEVCDVSVVSATKIKEKYNRYTHSEMLVIPNGYNYVKSNNGETLLLKDMEGIPKPVIGFIGTLFQFIDDTLLEYIISRRPHYSFVFIGNIENSFPVQKIKQFRNVYLLGRKPQNEITSYIHSFDVCINPFKVHEVNDSVNPVKVFEYLANKKHVVSSKMYSLMKENIASYVSFAENYDHFLALLDQALLNIHNPVPENVMQSYSWDSLFSRLISELSTRNKIIL